MTGYVDEKNSLLSGEDAVVAYFSFCHVICSFLISVHRMATIVRVSGCYPLGIWALWAFDFLVTQSWSCYKYDSVVFLLFFGVAIKGCLFVPCSTRFLMFA
jgi:hypothetical protein